MDLQRLILSTCGTSLLTNHADPDVRRLINTYSSVGKAEDIPQAERARILEVKEIVENGIKTATPQQMAKMSAEYNALKHLYDRKIDSVHDVHYLLCTDTWLCEVAAECLKQYIDRFHSKDVHILRQKDLNVSDRESFECALADLVKDFLEAVISDYRHKGFRIVFNLEPISKMSSYAKIAV